MDLAQLMPWVTAALAIIALLGHAKTFFGSDAKENAEDIRSVKAGVDDHALRLQALEAEMRHLPAKDDVTELKIAMAEIKGSVAVFNEGMGSLSRTVRRIEDFLMKEGK